MGREKRVGQNYSKRGKRKKKEKKRKKDLGSVVAECDEQNMYKVYVYFGGWLDVYGCVCMQLL